MIQRRVQEKWHRLWTTWWIPERLREKSPTYRALSSSLRVSPRLLGAEERLLRSTETLRVGSCSPHKNWGPQIWGPKSLGVNEHSRHSHLLRNPTHLRPRATHLVYCVSIGCLGTGCNPYSSEWWGQKRRGENASGRSGWGETPLEVEETWGSCEEIVRVALLREDSETVATGPVAAMISLARWASLPPSPWTWEMGREKQGGWGIERTQRRYRHLRASWFKERRAGGRELTGTSHGAV